MIGIRILLYFRPDYAPDTTHQFSFKERMEATRGLWAVIVLFLIVFGGIYSGFVFPSAAGAVGAVGALAIGLARRGLGPKEPGPRSKTRQRRRGSIS